MSERLKVPRCPMCKQPAVQLEVLPIERDGLALARMVVDFDETRDGVNLGLAIRAARALLDKAGV